MRLNELTLLLRALLDADVEFLIVGGLAVVAYGHVRVTHDLDLVLEMGSDNLNRAIGVFETHSFAPVLPVDIRSFLDREQRDRWIREKNVQVFSLYSDRYRSVVIDIFVELPFDMREEMARAEWIPFPDKGLRLPFVCKSTLVAMKKKAGRPHDQDDIEHLT